MKSVITAKNLNFSYDKQNLVLTDISFDVLENDFVALIGSNGGGKSTLLKLILALLQPASGSLEVLGTKPEIARKFIGYVPQYSRIDLDYPISAMEVVMSGLLGNKRLGTKYNLSEKERGIKIMKDLKLYDLQHKAIGELSGGQRQRIMIARALIREPKILLLDEPTNNVDEGSGKDLYELLHELNKRMTIIMVSHNVDVISEHVKRIFCLNNRMLCNSAEDITAGDIGSPMKKVIHSHNCTIN